MAIKIALAGNPNAGKTTIFNEITGSSQYVGNWPGVTVEKKEGKLIGYKEVTVVDLPGIYSLSPYTPEEIVTRNFLLQGQPDVIINVVDASNLERNLYLTMQLMEVGIPIVVALNMMDVVQNDGDHINTQKLAQELGCPVVETAATQHQGLTELLEQAIVLAHKGSPVQQHHQTVFATLTEQALAQITQIMHQRVIGNPIVQVGNYRWFAVKLFEGDKRVIQELKLPSAELTQIQQIVANCCQQFADDAESVITDQRYRDLERIAARCLQRHTRLTDGYSTRIDRIVTNRWLALPIFTIVIWGMYYLSIQTLGKWGNELVAAFFSNFLKPQLTYWLTLGHVVPWIQSLIVDGLVGGVGAVLTFVPQLMILFACLSLLEDCGYMARIAFIMDKIFVRFGLSGQSFIPMLIGSGCSVPAIMATRTIKYDQDRKMTILLTPFVPCSAKLPVFALFAEALFPGHSWVAPSMYLLGLVVVILSGILLKHTALFAGDPAPFIMELPRYKIPQWKNIALHVWDHTEAFIVRAGTVIVLASAFVWFLQSFSWSLAMVGAEESILASLGRGIAPLFSPLGFGNWQATVALATGFLAKETIVATLGVLLAQDPNLTSLNEGLATIFTPAGAYAFMSFTLLASPCFAAIGAMRRELGSNRWLWIAIGYQTFTAYLVALIIYQLGSGFLNLSSLLILVVLLIILLLAWKHSYCRGDDQVISRSPHCFGCGSGCQLAKSDRTIVQTAQQTNEHRSCGNQKD